MPPRGNGFVGSCAIHCIVALATVPAPAGVEPPLAVEVGCTEITPEQRASVEARSRAELAMVGVTEGQIDIQCWPPFVVVQYSSRGFPARSSSRHLVGGPDAWIDQILSTVHVLLTSNPTPMNSAVAATTSAQPAPLPTPAASSVSPEPTVKPVARPSDAPPRLVSEWKPEAASGEPLSLQTSIGACADVWVKPLAILPGACAVLGLQSSFARFALTGGVQLSATRVHDIGIRHWLAGLEWSVGHPLWVAIDGQLSVFQLMQSTNLSPDSRTRYDPSVTARGGISVPLANEHLIAGVGMRLQRAHDVYINDSKQFSLPKVALTIDAAYDFSW